MTKLGYITIPENYWESTHSIPLISEKSDCAYTVTRKNSSPNNKIKDNNG